MKPLLTTRETGHFFIRDKKSTWLVFVFLLLFIGWCANPWDLYFFNDDFIHIPLAGNAVIGQHNSLRHVNEVSLYLDSLFSGKSATGYHITNLLIYWANLLLSILLFKKLSHSFHQPIGRGVAIVMAALFGIFAFHSEAIFWIICRGASLSLFFCLLSWLCFFPALQQRSWLFPMLLFFIAGLFTYESVWVFPFWLVLWFMLLPRTSVHRGKARLPIALIWAIFLAYFPLRLKATGELLGTYEAGDVQQFRLVSIIGKSARLLARSFLPPVANPGLFALLAGAVFISLLVVAVILWKKAPGNRLLLFFALAWLLSYFPYVSLGVSTSGYESERFLYFPSFFLCATLVYSGVLLVQHPVKQAFFFAFIFLYHTVFFIKASAAYKSNSRLAKNAITAIQKVPLNKQLVIKNLPVYNYGLPVFNYGFFNALQWQAPGRNAINTKVLQKVKYKNATVSVYLNSAGLLSDTLFFKSE